VPNTNWQDKRVLVTGCAGFLGSWLTAQLVSSGAEVVGIFRDRVPNSQLSKSGTINHIAVVNGDVCDYELVERVIAEYEVNLIFHLAAQSIVSIANRAPLSTFETNIKGTWTVLEASRRNPTIQGVVIPSSYKAYGDQTLLPYHEDAPLRANHPYDVSKSCVDLLAQTYAHTYQLPVVVTRFVNIYGGGDLNWNRLVPGTVRSVVRGERPIIRSDGTFCGDYLFVADAVDGYLTIGEAMTDPAIHGQAFNFGMNRPISVLELVNTIIEISDCPQLEPIILNEVQNEVADQYSVSEKARTILGWQPQHTIVQGLSETMAWYRDYLSTN
jgi:CDP-glucose 4,6-dehydratase